MIHFFRGSQSSAPAPAAKLLDVILGGTFEHLRQRLGQAGMDRVS